MQLRGWLVEVCAYGVKPEAGEGWLRAIMKVEKPEELPYYQKILNPEASLWGDGIQRRHLDELGRCTT